MLIVFFHLGQKCYATEADFANQCNSLGGILSTGRCFYLAKEGGTCVQSSWTNGWAACNSHGNGVMAQIHFQNEMDDITTYLLVCSFSFLL